ncbi:Gfo/Idh/MocA family oxidoreductase [Magnetospira thiophila]
MSRALVVGHGAIGARHARLLAARGLEVAVVSRRPGVFDRQFTTLSEGLSGWQPDLLVIASRTDEHLSDLTQAAEAGFRGRVLVEKPFLHAPATLPGHRFADLRIGYNLRFHPVIQGLRRWLDGLSVFGCQFHVGQYLPDWRPQRDYRDGYSARREQGGGVLRDLSHELDLLLWLFGPWRRVTALGGQVSDLDIDSDDLVTLLVETERCPVVSVHLNYLDQPARRNILMQTSEGTLEADLIAGTLAGTRFELERDSTYAALHEDVLSGGGLACDQAQGLAVTHLIAAAERALSERSWVAP